MFAISSISKYIAQTIRKNLQERKIGIGLTLQITIEYIGDDVTFLNSILSIDYSSLQNYVQFSQEEEKEGSNSSVLLPLRNRLLSKMIELDNHRNIASSRAQLGAILRIFCGFVGIVGMQLSTSEVETILKVITANTNSER